MKAGLDALSERYDVVGDVRGEGLMCALEFVSDRAAKTPASGAAAAEFQKAAYEAGTMIRVSGNNAIYSPPLVITSEDVQNILAATEAGLKAM